MKKYLLVISLFRFLVVVIFILPNISLAATTADLQAQIAALLAQIQALQAQMSQQQPQQWCYDFKYNLNSQSSGKEVGQLQTALEKEGFIIDSYEKTNQIFDESIADAVIGFQQKYKDEILAPYKLKYGTGFVGKSTRAKLNSLYGCGVIQPIPTPIPIPIPTPINQQPTISGVSGPTTLNINQTGTWEIKASDPEQGNLNYQVFWGDEAVGASAQLSKPLTYYSQIATFTHSYFRTGIYYPTFTVTDNQGLSAKTSISVNVGSAIITSPVLSISTSTILNSNVFILEDDGALSSNANHPDVLTKKFYEVYPNQDVYDFIGFHFKNGAPGGSTYGYQAQYSDQGTFMSNRPDQTALYGSNGNLLGGYVDSFDFNKVYVEIESNNDPISLIDNFYFGLLFHEITHRWGVILPEQLKEALVGSSYPSEGHFEFFTGSWVAVRPTTRLKLIENSDGSYHFKIDCFSEPKQHDFDLYSMGLKTSSEIKEKLIITNQSGQIPGLLQCSAIEISKDFVRKSYTIQDFIDVLGPRMPSVIDSKKDFTMAFVLIVPKGMVLSQEEISAMNWIAAKFPITWYKSTEKRSTLNNIKPTDLTPPLISNVKISTTESSITAVWTTNESTTSFVIYAPQNFNSIISFGTGINLTTPPKFSTDQTITVKSDDLTPINPNTEYSIQLISIDENYNLASFDAGKIKTVAATTAPFITVLSPNGGEVFTKGAPYKITWSSTGFASDAWAQIQFQDAATNQIVKLITSSASMSAGSYSGTVPFDIPDGKYIIWMTGPWPSITDSSDAPFSVVATTTIPSITVTSPNSGETLAKGSIYRIKWNSASVIDKVSLGYSFGTGSLNWIATSIPNTGYYDWTVNIGNTTNNQAKIYIIGYQTGVGSWNDYSDNYFTVASAVTSADTINQMASVLQSAEKILMEILRSLNR